MQSLTLMALHACMQVCKEAEIEVITTDSTDMSRTVYITKGSEGPVKSERKAAEAAGEAADDAA